MSIYVPNGAELKALEEIRTGLLQGGTLRLFISNHTPVEGDTASTYNAIEASFGGYAALTLNGWITSFTNASNIAETDETLRTFTATGAGLPETVYGVYYLDPAGALAYAELNPGGGVLIAAAGQTFSYFPVYTLQTG